MAEMEGKTAVEADGNLDVLLQQIFEERGYDFRDYKRASIVRLDLQNRIITKFHYALDKNGYVFFGKSESMLTGSRLFFPINKTWRIFQKAAGTAPGMALAERRLVSSKKV